MLYSRMSTYIHTYIHTYMHTFDSMLEILTIDPLLTFLSTMSLAAACTTRYVPCTNYNIHGERVSVWLIMLW